MSWRILEKWFNIAPWKDAEYIADTQGEKFWISWSDLREDVAKLRIRYRSYPAGHVNLIEEDEAFLTLADIHVSPPYRGRRLGKQMMDRVISWAKQSGYREICGVIRPSKEAPLEYLQEWYRRRGFIVNNRQLKLDLKKM